MLEELLEFRGAFVRGWVVERGGCVYLRHPRRNGLEVWDDLHVARVFETFWEAAWQALRHFPSTPRLIGGGL